MFHVTHGNVWHVFSDQNVKLFHHTDKKGSKGIARSGEIKQSIPPKKKGTDDARHGAGAYFTTLGPETSKMDVALNNYGPNAAAAMVKRGRTDAVVEVTVQKKDVEHVLDQRDIWVHRGDLQLHKNMEPKFHVHHRDGGFTSHGTFSAQQSETYSSESDSPGYDKYDDLKERTNNLKLPSLRKA